MCSFIIKIAQRAAAAYCVYSGHLKGEGRGLRSGSDGALLENPRSVISGRLSRSIFALSRQFNVTPCLPLAKFFLALSRKERERETPGCRSQISYTDKRTRGRNIYKEIHAVSYILLFIIRRARGDSLSNIHIYLTIYTVKCPF